MPNIPPNLPIASDKPSQPQEPLKPKMPMPAKPSAPPQTESPAPFKPKFSTPQEPKRIVPERQAAGQIFPKKATEELPQKPEVDRFGAPQDIVPKSAPKEEKPSFMPEEGLSPEQVERRETIKKVLIFLIIISLVVFAVVLIFTRLKSKKQEQPTATVTPFVLPSPTVGPETDSDADGMPDLWEKEHGLNPNDPKDAKSDIDVDKLVNLDEYKYKTDPQKADSDGDTFKDGDEVRNGYNPTGPGKLETGETENGTKNFPTIKGAWLGQMTGSTYQIKDLDLTMQADGKLTGKFTTTYLAQYKIQNEVAGDFDFKKDSGVFSTTLNGTATFLGKTKTGQNKGEFTLVLEGKETNGEITGTWTMTPKDSSLVWLKSDRGNLKIVKQ